MKLQIYASKSTVLNYYYWTVRTPFSDSHYASFDAAQTYLNKFMLRYRKEASAYSMASTIAINLLDLKDQKFIKKMLARKCIGISKPQYGYLKGIHERQQREW